MLIHFDQRLKTDNGNPPPLKKKIISVSHVGLRPEGRRPLGRPRRRWEDNIKMDHQDVGGGMDWIKLALDKDRWRALVNGVMNLRVP
jgi:hypothetical protein